MISDRPDQRFAKGESLLVGERELTVASFSERSKGYLVGFSEIMSRNEAEALRGAEIFVERNEAVLAEGEFFHDDLIGFAVATDEGKDLGLLREIYSTGANDVYEVGTDEQTWLIPAIKDVITKIDKDRRLITVHELEGLLE